MTLEEWDEFDREYRRFLRELNGIKIPPIEEKVSEDWEKKLNRLLLSVGIKSDIK